MKEYVSPKDRKFFWEYVPKNPGHKFTLQIFKYVVVYYVGTHSHKWGEFYFETIK